MYCITETTQVYLCVCVCVYVCMCMCVCVCVCVYPCLSDNQQLWRPTLHQFSEHETACPLPWTPGECCCLLMTSQPSGCLCQMYGSTVSTRNNDVVGWWRDSASSSRDGDSVHGSNLCPNPSLQHQSHHIPHVNVFISWNARRVFRGKPHESERTVYKHMYKYIHINCHSTTGLLQLNLTCFINAVFLFLIFYFILHCC